MRLLTRFIIGTAVVGSLSLFAGAGEVSNSNSQMRPGFVTVPPFIGEKSETWEEFSPHQAYAALTILDGAMISGPSMQIYRADGAGQGLGSFAAGVTDGAQGIALPGRAQSATIMFPLPVIDFGAYWGSMASSLSGTASSLISFTFLDADGNEVGTDSFTYTSADHNGALAWRGYHFSTPVKIIIYSGDNVVTDGLQVATALPSMLRPVPSTGPTVTVTASPSQIEEGEDATYTIQCSPPPTTPITVYFVIRGTAQENGDYGLEPSLHQADFAPGQAVANILLYSVPDTIPERGETAIMVLTKGAGYRLGSLQRATVVIKNVPF